MIRTLRHNELLSPVPVRESARLRPLVAGYTATKCAAQAENAFRRRVPGRVKSNICLEDISLHREETLRRSRWNCNEVSCQTHALLSSSGYTNREKYFRSKLRHFPGSCTRLLMVEVFQTSAQVES